MEKQQPDQLETYEIRPASLADSPAALELFNVCSLAMSGRIDTDLQSINAEGQMPGLALERSTGVVMAPDLQLIAHELNLDFPIPPNFAPHVVEEQT
jgi:hypothetical protein